MADYFRENKDAARTAEETTEVIGWITNHEHICEIFDATQLEKGAGIPLSYLVANLTRWTTHSISFNCQIRLKDSLRHAAIIHRQEIIDAQLGAEKNKKKIQKIKESAGRFCDLLDDGGYWKRLQTVADDIEPICYITNINQADNTRTDQVLLGFAGVFLHFQRHPNLQLRRAMMKQIEKRWAALDQPMFIFTMVLNPYEHLDRFGTEAGVNVFSLSNVLVEVSHSSSS